MHSRSTENSLPYRVYNGAAKRWKDVASLFYHQPKEPEEVLFAYTDNHAYDGEIYVVFKEK